ncbi:hypothetical protein ABPG74_020071 [Tetrahymena malaccensis]
MERIQNNTYNFDQMLCQKHFLPCQYLHIDSNSSDHIYACTDCVIQNNNYKQFLNLLNIIDKQDNTVLTNWPLLYQQELLNQVQSLSFYQGDQPRIQNYINQYFEVFQNEIIKTLQTQKKNMLIYANHIQENTKQLFNYYKEIAQFDTLKDIINSNSQKQQKAEQILQIFQTNKQKQEEYITKIKSELSKLNQYQILDLDGLNCFKGSILSQIQLIDINYISQLKIFSSKSNILIDEFKKQQQNKNILLKENENLDILLKLISNKTNNCNEKYLQSVKSELLKIKDTINVLKFEQEIFHQGKKQIQTENLNQDQIDCLEMLTNKTIDLNQQYSQLKEEDQNMLISSKLQPSSNLIFHNIFKLDKLLTKEKLESISKLLRRFPIFEIEQLVKPQPCQLEIEISNWQGFNNNGKQSYDNDGNQKFEIVQGGYFIFYMKIKQDSIYRLVIKFELLNPTYKHLFIGLVGKSHKNCQNVHQNSLINSYTVSNYGDKGVSKVVKGKCLRDVQQQSQIEITFCVKRKIFQVCDYPKRENINEINDDKLNLIDTNQEYSLGFELHNLKDSLTILECEELQQQN